MTVNQEEFTQEMQKQKERARNAASVETGDWVQLQEGESEFVGYDILSCDVEILRYRKIKQKNSEFYQIVLNRTPFYAEMGGQVGDTGIIESKTAKAKVVDCKKNVGGKFIHYVEIVDGTIEKNQNVVLTVNKDRRDSICKNHTATHMLHKALKEVLGDHVNQSGSYVDDERLRFDFTHFSALTEEEIKKVQDIVNENIMSVMKVDTKEMSILEVLNVRE